MKFLESCVTKMNFYSSRKVLRALRMYDIELILRVWMFNYMEIMNTYIVNHFCFSKKVSTMLDSNIMHLVRNINIRIMFWMYVLEFELWKLNSSNDSFWILLKKIICLTWARQVTWVIQSIPYILMSKCERFSTF